MKAFLKVTRVIQSCETLGQFKTASAYAKLFREGNSDPFDLLARAYNTGTYTELGIKFNSLVAKLLVDQEIKNRDLRAVRV